MSNNYWEKRQVQDAFDYISKASEAADEIAKVYLKASRYLSLEADQIFERYQTKHSLSGPEAMRLLNELSDEASLDELLEKLRNGSKDESRADLLKRLEAPAYQARLERLRQLQNQLDWIMQNVYQQEKDMNTSFYVDLAREAYYKNIFRIQQRAEVAFSFGHISADMIDKVINSRWSGENYSKRIWENTKALSQSLKEELLINLITGRSNRDAAEIIAHKFAVGSGRARTLVQTESNFLCTEMNFRSYKACGLGKYRYLATLDLRTCQDKCATLDGKVFLISERKIGENCPPIHPRCRCTTVAIVLSDDIERMKRAARDPKTGKTIKVPASMTYSEWYKRYVASDSKARSEEKKTKNRTGDRKQYEEYKKIIGKRAGKTLDDFQEMKYNDTERWEDTKAYKQYAAKHPDSTWKDYSVQREIKEAGIKGITSIRPEKIEVSEYTYDNKHINAERAHMVSRVEAERFIKEADISITRWNGRFVNYYSKNGATYVDVENKNIRTSFTSKEFDENTLKIREVAEKYAGTKSHVSNIKKTDK